MTPNTAFTLDNACMPEQDLQRIAPGLALKEDGIWRGDHSAAISYPEEGNQNCLALEADSFWFEHRNQCILALMKRYAPGGRVFDIGGGNGYVALGLQRAGYPVVLLEPGEGGACVAHQRGVEQVICASLQEAGFLPGSLSAAGLFDVLEHIEPHISFLGELQKSLASGGRIYISVPAYGWLWSADDDYAGHYRRYNLRQLRQTLRAAGFEPEFETYFFGMLPLPSFLLRTLPSRLGLRKQNAWQQYQQEHSTRPGLLGFFLNSMLKFERWWLRRGWPLPVGSSCLVVAHKV